MMVKICGITNREDAVAAAEAGASALGFVFYPGSPRHVTAEVAREISDGLPGLKVGVFVDAAPDEIAGFEFLDVFQLHGQELPASIAQYSKPVWKAFRVDQRFDPACIAKYHVDAFLFDGPHPGSGQQFDWTRITGLTDKFLLAGGLDDTNVADAIRAVRPWGVDASSRLESSPRRKDHEKMKRFVQAANSVLL